MEELKNNPDVKETSLIRSQALIHIINANVTYCPWPRGSGKTSGGIGPRILHLSERMPRSQIGLVADTFTRIEKSLLPGLEGYWQEELGLLPGIDYVSHKRPPDHWRKPLFVPKDWSRVTAFASGFIVCEISLEVEGSANGFNLQAIIGDEVKFWSEQRFKGSVKPAIRGGKKYFGHLPEFQSQWFFSDKLPERGADITWVLKKKKEVSQELVDIVYTLQMKVFDLQNEMKQYSSTETIYKCKKQIEELEEILRQLRIDLVYYCDALPYENKENLGDKYYRDQKRDLTKFEYEVAIENKDPDRAIEPYYIDFSKQNLYRSKTDVNPNKSLIMAADWQHNITPVVTAQFDRLNGSPYTTLNFVQSLHSLPGSIDAAMKLWCDAFTDHQEKHVYFIYDHTAIGRSPHGSTFKDKVVDYLVKAGWSVTEVYTGDAPDHDIKHEALKKWLMVRADRAILMNEYHNEFLKISMEKAEAILVGGKTKKDKSSEKSKKVPPEESTHYSDAFDQIVWGALELDLVPISDDPGMDITGRTAG